MTQTADIDFGTWVAQNIQNIRNGAGSYQGNRVTGDSTVVRYFSCMSCVVFSVRQTSKYLLQGTDEDRNTNARLTLLTLFLGWWGFPFGLIFTPTYLVKNLTGGEKCTVNDLIFLIENPEEAKKKRDRFSYAPLIVLIVGILLVIPLAVLVSMFKHTPTHANVSQKPPAYKDGSQFSDPEVTSYMNTMQYSLKEYWSPPHGTESSQVLVGFRLDGKGHVHDLKIGHSSGDAKCDAAALEAVRKADPLPALPKSLNGSAQIEFTFDYNVIDEGQTPPRRHHR
ncbi:MAG TPA: energy transducer TonB [Oculatellaceae cyanobacterium]